MRRFRGSFLVIPPRTVAPVGVAAVAVVAVVAAAVGVVAVVVAGCGSGAGAVAHRQQPFGWLHPAAPPATWRVARLPGSTALAYPPEWHRIRSDPGTVSAARVDPSGLVVDYVNATPQQGEETLQNWSRFRPAHNVEEGDRHERLLAAAQGLRFRDGRGSCVIDTYRTPRTSYKEIACLVQARARATVVVAAGLVNHWAQDAPTLQRAVSAFVA